MSRLLNLLVLIFGILNHIADKLFSIVIPYDIPCIEIVWVRGFTVPFMFSMKL